MTQIDTCNALYQQLLASSESQRTELGDTEWLRQTFPVIRGWTLEPNLPHNAPSLVAVIGLSGKILMKSSDTSGLVLMLDLDVNAFREFLSTRIETLNTA